MSLKVYKISDYNHRVEEKQFESIRQFLSKHYAFRNEDAILIGNYNIEGVELDALLIAPGGYRILEFKNWGGDIIARENGSWTSKGKIIEGGSGKKTPGLGSHHLLAKIQHRQKPDIKYSQPLASYI